MTEHRSFNPDALRDILEIESDGEPGLLETLIGDFQNRAPQLVTEIEAAVSSLNWKALELYAHALKSSSKLLGLDETAEICGKIEDQALRSRLDASAFETLHFELEIGLRELREYVNRISGGIPSPSLTCFDLRIKGEFPESNRRSLRCLKTRRTCPKLASPISLSSA